MENLPFREEKIGENVYIRRFSKNVKNEKISV